MKVNLLALNSITNDARVHKTAKSLVAAGYEVVVTGLKKDGLAENELSSGYRIIRIKLRDYKGWSSSISLFAKYFEFAWKVSQRAEKDTATIYHAFDANTLPAAWIAARRARSKLIYDARELETGRNFSASHVPGIIRRYWALPEKLFIRQAAAIITTSQSHANELVRIYHIPAPWVVKNCPEIYSSEKSNRIHEEFAIPNSNKIVLYQGLLTPGRGIENLFQAIQPLPQTVAVALGDGPSLEDLRYRARQGEWQRVYLPGKVPLKELLSYTSSADIGSVLIEDVCLSYRLSLPNKLFEYIQAGLPVIGSNLPEIARVIHEHEIGEVITPENIPDITRAISRLIDDPLHYHEIQLNVQRAAQIYNWENESKKLLQAYSSVAQG